MPGKNMQIKSEKLHSYTETDKKDNRDNKSSEDKKNIQKLEYRVQKLEDAYKDDAMRAMGYISCS